VFNKLRKLHNIVFVSYLYTKPILTIAVCLFVYEVCFFNDDPPIQSRLGVPLLCLHYSLQITDRGEQSFNNQHTHSVTGAIYI